MEGGCQVPIAGFAQLNDKDEIVLTGLVASPDGKMIYKERSIRSKSGTTWTNKLPII